MNKLTTEKRTQILTMLVEGNSLRATSRMADVSINTVTKLLVDAGKACQDYHNENVMNVKTKRIQCDEIWSFVYAKDKNAPADIWTNCFIYFNVGSVWINKFGNDVSYLPSVTRSSWRIYGSSRAVIITKNIQ